MKNILKITMIMLAFISLSVNGFSQPNWEEVAHYTTPTSNPGGVWYGDFDSDGYQDIITRHYNDAKISILMNNGDGTFANAQTITAASYVRDCQTADFNQDGNTDFVFTNTNSAGAYTAKIVTVYLGNGDGTFQNFSTYSLWGAFNYHVEVGDINNDGYTDILTSSAGLSYNGFVILTNNQDGTFTLGNHYTGGNEGSEFRLADFNEDGNLDVVQGFVYGNGEINTFSGNGDGTFGSRTIYMQDWSSYSTSGPRPMGVGNFDNQNGVDILVDMYDKIGGTNNKFDTYILKNDGTGNFTTQLVIENYRPTQVLDWNNDGVDDILAREYIYGSNEYGSSVILLNDGTGNFEAPIEIIDFPIHMEIIDLNNDNFWDIATYDGANNNIDVYLQITEIAFAIQTEADYAQLNNSVSIPVTATSELTADDGIYSYQFVYNFDETKLQYVDYDLTGTIAEGGTVNVNTSVAGQLTVSCMRTTPITGQGDLIYFNFNAIAEGTSPLTVSSFKYNETDVTDVTNGDITIVPVTVADVTYSTDVILPGTELEITVEFNNAITGTPQFELSGANTLSATDLGNVSGNTYTYTYTVQAGEGIVNLGVLGTDEYGFDVTYSPTTGATFEILSLTYGDVTDNGEITAYDAALALMYSVGVDPMPAEAPLPWELWRILTADVDGVGGVTATDAGMILQYSVGLISTFPVENTKGGTAPKSGDITVEVVGNEFVFTTESELVGFNLFVTNNSNVVLGTPEFLDQNMLTATQIEGETYNIGTCIAIAPANGTEILRIPFTGELTGELIFNMKVNNSDKSVSFGTTGITEIDNGISIFPNPASETIQINTDMILDKSTVEIYSINGNLIKTKTLNNQSEINISDLPTGTYLMKINVDNKTLTEKFIKE